MCNELVIDEGGEADPRQSRGDDLLISHRWPLHYLFCYLFAASSLPIAYLFIQVKAAEADAEAKYLAGTGIARQRQAIINGLRESVVHFQQDITDITSKDVMEMMMMTQYFDTMQHIGSSQGNSTIFVPSGPGAVADAASAVRSGIMQGNLASGAALGGR